MAEGGKTLAFQHLTNQIVDEFKLCHLIGQPIMTTNLFAVAKLYKEDKSPGANSTQHPAFLGDNSTHSSICD